MMGTTNINIPINHKTVFLFDYSSYFSASCGEIIEFDSSSSSSAAKSSNSNNLRIDSLTKSLWTCNVEAAFEYARIVYDLFPENKLIRLVISRLESPLNSWSEAEQGLEFLTNLMGNIPPPPAQAMQIFEGEEFIILCKSLNLIVNSIAQASPLQQKLFFDNKQQQPPAMTLPDQIPNSGRIILFSSSELRNFDQLQEFVCKSVEEWNKNLEQIQKAEKLNQQLNWLKISKLELVIIDLVRADRDLLFEREIVKQNSNEVRTRLICCKSGRHLPMKMIQMVKNFYDLSITSITNIPMKEEQNASSSANYDVDILHVKSLHDQLKICGLVKQCTVRKEVAGGFDAVCLKWSNPKTNINEFNFTNCAFRITPIDVNSRPASCLTSFLLGGRCVVLEVNNNNPQQQQRIVKVSSHVLCNHGNELFMHCLNFSGGGKSSNLDDNRPSIENLTNLGRLIDYRTVDFNEFVKEHTFSNLPFLTNSGDAKPNAFIPQMLSKLEIDTRKWPLIYSDCFITNLQHFKPLVRHISSETLTDHQYAECFKCIEYFQNAETRNENLAASTNIIIANKFYTNLKRKDQFRFLWKELESYLRAYKDLSEKHFALYKHAKEIQQNFLRNESILNYELSLLINNSNKASDYKFNTAGAASADNIINNNLIALMSTSSFSINNNANNNSNTLASSTVNRLQAAKLIFKNYSKFDKEFENEKLSKKTRTENNYLAATLNNVVATAMLVKTGTKEQHEQQQQQQNLLQIWTRAQNENIKNSRKEFHGRLNQMANSNQAQLYLHLKLDEQPGLISNSNNSNPAATAVAASGNIKQKLI